MGDTTNNNGGGDQQERVFTQEEVNRMLAKERRDNEREAAKRYQDYDDLKAKADKLEEMERENATEHERAIAEAVEKATQETRAEVEKTYRARIAQAEVRSVVSQFLDSETAGKLAPIIDASKFMDKNGDVDTDELAGALTAIVEAMTPGGSAQNPGFSYGTTYRTPANPQGSGTNRRTDWDEGLERAKARGFITND